MSSKEAARYDLENSVTAYMCCKSTIARILTSATDVSSQTLTSEMEKFEVALKDLNRSHTTWVCRSEFSDKQLAAERYSQEWLENEWGQSFVLETKIDILLSALSTTPPTLTNKQKLHQYCAQMETLKSDMLTGITRLSQLTIPVLQHDYDKLLSDLKDKLSGEYSTTAQVYFSSDIVKYHCGSQKLPVVIERNNC